MMTQARWRFILIFVVLVVIGFGVLGVIFVTRTTPPTQPLAMPTNPIIEERWGVRVTQIGVIADGGLVDLRFIVVDPDKALAMMQEVENLPVLVAEESNSLVNSAALMAAHHTLQPGRTYFLLYRNTRGAIKHGGQVSVYFRDPLSDAGKTLRIEHFMAQ